MPFRKFIRQLPAEAARLLRAANELALAHDLQSVTAVVAETARDLTGADGVTFVLREGSQCHYVDENAIAPLWKGCRFALNACISGWVIQHGEPVAIEDVYDDDRIPGAFYRPTFVKSLAMVPVRSPDAIAAIGAYWRDRHVATDEELGRMMLLADSAALALANVHLNEEARRALLREREARAEAERATSAKDEFLAFVAHELRQPLHASIAAIRLLSLHQDQPEAAARARTVVARQIQQMNRIVEDLLDAARIVRGQITLNTEPIDLRPIVEQVVDAMRPLIAEREQQLSVDLPTMPLVVEADSARMQQVLMNIFANASKFTPSGGHIRVSGGDGDGRITLSVRDTGEGIDAATLPRIFDLFTRGSSTAGGFGVGLAVARRLVELHGGTIEARSMGIDQGSEFIVRLARVAAGV